MRYCLFEDYVQSGPELRVVYMISRVIRWLGAMMTGATLLGGATGCMITNNPALLGLDTDHGATFFNEAQHLFDTGQYDAALALAERALAAQEAQNGSERILIGKTTNLLGLLWSAKGDDARADTYFQRTLQLWGGQFGVYQAPIAAVLGNRALSIQNLGRFAEAEQLLARAFEILEKSSGAEDTELGLLHNIAGRLYLSKGEYEKAKRQFERSLQLLDSGEGAISPRIAAIYGNLGEANLRTGDYVKSAECYERALVVSRRFYAKPHPQTALLLGSLGAVYQDLGKLKLAEQTLVDAVSMVEKELGPNHPQSIMARNNLGNLYHSQHKLVEAENLMRQVLSSTERIQGPAHVDVALAANNLAMVVSEQNKIAEAEALMLRALAIWENHYGPKHPLVGLVLSNLAMVYRNKGEVAKAQEMEQRATTIRLQSLGREHPDTVQSTTRLAELSVARGDFLQGEQLALHLLEEDERRLGPDHIKVAGNLGLLARIYTQKGDPKRAMPLLVRAMTIEKKVLGPAHPLVGLTANDMGMVFLVLQDPVQAAEFYQMAVKIFEVSFGPDNQALPIPLNGLAMAVEKQGHRSKAAGLYVRALTIEEKFVGSDHADLAAPLNNLARLYTQDQKYDLAEQYLLRAMRIAERAWGSTHPLLVTILNNLTVLSWRQADLRSTIARVEQMTAIQDQNAAREMGVGAAEHRRAYFETLRVSTDVAVSLHVQWTGSSVEAQKTALRTILRRKGLIVDTTTNSFANLRPRLVPADQVKFDEWRSITAEYSSLMQSSVGETPSVQVQAKLKTLNAARKELENELTFRSKDLKGQLAPVTVEQVRDAIPRDAVLVELFQYAPFDPTSDSYSQQWGPPRFVAYLLHPDGKLDYVDLGPVKPIEEATRALRKALSRVTTNPQVAAKELYQLVMAPIVELLGKTDRIYLSPDGALCLVPFGALVDAKGRYLAETMSITYLTTGRDLANKTSTQSTRPAAIFAAPDYGISAQRTARQFELFRAGAQEGNEVAVRLPGAMLFDGAKARESALKALHGPSILHISTHGFFDKADSATSEAALLRSGLAFAGANLGVRGGEDGILTALEASQLDLWGTKLVVLSACETGLGAAENGDGVYGLRRAFTIAGAETVVMSLWAVDTAATTELVKRYYDGLSTWEGRAEALRKAQLAMLASKERTHPYYWASFIVSGNDEPMANGSGQTLFGQVKPGNRGCTCEFGKTESGPNPWAWTLFVAAVTIAKRRRVYGSH